MTRKEILKSKGQILFFYISRAEREPIIDLILDIDNQTMTSKILWPVGGLEWHRPKTLDISIVDIALYKKPTKAKIISTIFGDL